MSTTDVIEQALKLKASERYLLLEMLHQSLDKPDRKLITFGAKRHYAG